MVYPNFISKSPKSKVMKFMNIQILYRLFVIIVFGMSIWSCNKKLSCQDGSFVTGYIIGFDPCTANSNNKKGFVIKFENTNDTIVAYFSLSPDLNLPDSLYSDFTNNFLFPLDARNKYMIRAKYRQANKNEETLIFCRPDIYLGDFWRTTGGKQYVIECFEK